MCGLIANRYSFHRCYLPVSQTDFEHSSLSVYNLIATKKEKSGGTFRYHILDFSVHSAVWWEVVCGQSKEKQP